MHSATEEVRSGDADSGVLQVAVVSGPRAVHFITAAQDRAVLEERLAGYVAQNASVQLFPEEAAEVRELLSEQGCSAAIESYFSAVGRRWDQEWLSIHTVPMTDGKAEEQQIVPRSAAEHRVPVSRGSLTPGRGARMKGDVYLLVPASLSCHDVERAPYLSNRLRS